MNGGCFRLSISNPVSALRVAILIAALFTVFAFAGPACALTLLSENFDGEILDPVVPPSLPAGWASAGVSTGGFNAPVWATHAGTDHPPGVDAHSAPNVAFFNSYNTNDGNSARLYTTSGINLSTASSAQLTFWMYHDSGCPSLTPSDRVQPQVSTDGGTTWIDVGAAVNRYDGTIGWRQETVDLSAYAGNTDVRIGFLGMSRCCNDCHIDDVEVTAVLPLELIKSFTDDPVLPGETVTLEFTIQNTDAAAEATGITFTDDLNAALSGLQAFGLPMYDICGAGSSISDTSFLTLTGGTLPAGGSCTFSVTLQVPMGANPGTYPNTTSSLWGDLGGTAVTGGPATDDLTITALKFSKSFDGPTVPGGAPTLSFTIENTSSTETVTGLSFTDNLAAALSGLTAVAPLQVNPCGTGSTLAGTSSLTMTDGNLLAGESCTFSVTLQVPAGALPGSYPNTTSPLFLEGIPMAKPATADLTVEPPPIFSKAFTPDTIATGGTSTLTFTIDNTASALAATDLAFTDNLPAGVDVADPSNASTTCSGGSLTAGAVPGTITYSGGSVPAGASCTIQVDVTSNAVGVHSNITSDLTSSSGNSGPAAADLTVQQGYAVTYDGNGNTGGTAPAAQVKIDGVNLTLAANTGGLARTGHTFNGWNTETAGSGTHYDEGATYATNAALALYAEWTPVPYTVTYDCNGATGGSVPVDGSTYMFADPVTVLGNTESLVKTGCTFAGWNTVADGSGTTYNGGDTFFMGDLDVTLYAQWADAGPAAIPALSEWGVILFSLLMAVAAVLFLRNRKSAAP